MRVAILPVAQWEKNVAAASMASAEGVDVGLVVVDVERRAGGGGDAELAHQGLGAVVARPHAHAVLVEHLGEVVGVQVAVGEAEHAAAGGRLGRAVDGELRRRSAR